MSETRSYWHIASDQYIDGDPLRCRDLLVQDGAEVAWKWADADEGFDGNVVCMFPDTARGRVEADWLWSDYPTYHLLRIDVPAELQYLVSEVEEGYPAVTNEIPAEWITLVRTGYDADAVRQPGDEY